jgi:hypothetical protein
MVPLQLCRPAAAAPWQNTESFSKDAFLLVKIDHTIGDDYIHAFVCHRKASISPRRNSTVSNPSSSRSRAFVSISGHVTPITFPLVRLRERPETIESGAGSQIETFVLFPEGDGERITTAQSEVRGGRKRGIRWNNQGHTGGSAAIVGIRRFSARSGAITLPHFFAIVSMTIRPVLFHDEMKMVCDDAT